MSDSRGKQVTLNYMASDGDGEIVRMQKIEQWPSMLPVGSYYGDRLRIVYYRVLPARKPDVPATVLVFLDDLHGKQKALSVSYMKRRGWDVAK